MGVGIHLLLDGYQVAPEKLTDAVRLAQALRDAAAAAGLRPLSDPVLYPFPGGGLTGFLPLAESHMAFHTYPERGYIAADLFTCGDPQGAERAAAVLRAALEPGYFVCRKLPRGADTPP